MATEVKDNGTANRVKDEIAKLEANKKSRFQNCDTFIATKPGKKPKSSIVVKSDEGNVTLTTKSVKEGSSVKDIQDIVLAEGCTASTKSGVVGAAVDADITKSKSFEGATASEFVGVMLL